MSKYMLDAYDSYGYSVLPKGITLEFESLVNDYGVLMAAAHVHLREATDRADQATYIVITPME